MPRSQRILVHKNHNELLKVIKKIEEASKRVMTINWSPSSSPFPFSYRLPMSFLFTLVYFELIDKRYTDAISTYWSDGSWAPINYKVH